MGLTFDSRSIKRTLLLEHLDGLSPPEAKLLKDELIAAIAAMEEKLTFIARERIDSGFDHETDWQIRIRRKQEVCKVFLAKILASFNPENESSVFQKTYTRNFRRLLLTVITEEKYEELRQKAKDLTLEELL